jgi:hypothetical protein
MKYAILFLIISSIHVQGQIGGELELVRKSKKTIESQRASTKEIMVTAQGVDPDQAEKQAISDAVRRAVGSYIDAKTIVENDAVIKDRILSVSSGFVKKYEVTSPAQKNKDGLYQISIKATVETDQVATALKDAKIFSNEIDGKSLWAESNSKSLNAEEARKMLEEKLPEMYKSLFKIQRVGSRGHGSKSLEPDSMVENARDKTVTLSWNFDVVSNESYYKSYVLPLLKKCFEAAAGSTAKPVQLKSNGDFFNLNTLGSGFAFIATNFSASLDHADGFYFEKPLRSFRLRAKLTSLEESTLVYLNLKLKSRNGKVVKSEKCFLPRHDERSKLYNISPSPFFFERDYTCVVSALFSTSTSYKYWTPVRKIPCEASITIPLSEMKEVSKVEFDLSVAEFDVAIVERDGNGFYTEAKL